MTNKPWLVESVISYRSSFPRNLIAKLLQIFTPAKEV